MTLCDIFISKRPCRILHFHHSLAVFLPYVTFSIIYWAAGGRRENGIPAIYPVLNWDNLPLTIPFVLAGLTVGVFFGHALVWALHLLRDRVLRTCTTKDELVDKGHFQSQSNPGFVPDWVL
ncbi:hypothetical protein DAPPUDRAFT_258434 [Daphnia pulex]|uniref:Uncharacterized protein n=1 Tax=Daphnia pulex TaxID=6669 RepID=E9HFD8_DAPPU|nr:hypothetical protein DAPPUDRAFT_258434 [Daphnia pulex]|eukprot:EFX69514.1 hypothetical protein DAPPUDRAFT_258434 [Daphnia pulex]